MIVEIDETKVGKRKYQRGRRVDGVWVFGGVVRRATHAEALDFFAFAVPDRTAETLIDAIRRNIASKTTIYSDCWAAYNKITDHEDYKHGTVNHSIYFVDPDDPELHTNTIESLWKKLKHEALPCVGTRREYYDYYIAEYWWRQQLLGRGAFRQLCLMIEEQYGGEARLIREKPQVVCNMDEDYDKVGLNDECDEDDENGVSGGEGDE